MPPIPLEDLITNKRVTGRMQDLADVEQRESAQTERNARSYFTTQPRLI